MSALSPRHDAPGRQERGAALVEFSIVIGLFVLLVSGIISYGVILSYKQVLTQAASDGARAAAITIDDPGIPGDERISAAQDALDESLDSYGRQCVPAGDEGLTCDVDIVPCSGDPAATCVTVVLAHDNRGHPIVVPFGPFEQLTPATINVSTVAVVTGAP